MDGEEDPPFDDGGSTPDDGERWFDADEPVSDGDTEVHSRLENDDENDEDEGDPFATAHSLSSGQTSFPGENEPERSPGEDEPEGSSGEPEPPPAEEPVAADEEEPGDIEPLTPENIERMLHERAPFFLDPDEPATDSELEAVEGEETLPSGAGGSLPSTRATIRGRAVHRSAPSAVATASGGCSC